MNSYLPAELVELLRVGNENALTRIAEQFKSTLYHYCIRRLWDKRDADEAVSDIFVHMWNHREKIESSDHLKRWLFTVARHRCIDSLRKNRHRKTLPLPDTTEVEEISLSNINILLQFDYITLYEELYDMIDHLPDKYRSIMKMKIKEGYSTKEIAQMTRQSWHQVHNLILAATKLLRKSFKQNKALGIATLLAGWLTLF